MVTSPARHHTETNSGSIAEFVSFVLGNYWYRLQNGFPYPNSLWSEPGTDGISTQSEQALTTN